MCQGGRNFEVLHLVRGKSLMDYSNRSYNFHLASSFLLTNMTSGNPVPVPQLTLYSPNTI